MSVSGSSSGGSFVGIGVGYLDSSGNLVDEPKESRSVSASDSGGAETTTATAAAALRGIAVTAATTTTTATTATTTATAAADVAGPDETSPELADMILRMQGVVNTLIEDLKPGYQPEPGKLLKDEILQLATRKFSESIQSDTEAAVAAVVAALKVVEITTGATGVSLTEVGGQKSNRYANFDEKKLVTLSIEALVIATGIPTVTPATRIIAGRMGRDMASSDLVGGARVYLSEGSAASYREQLALEAQRRVRSLSDSTKEIVEGAIPIDPPKKAKSRKRLQTNFFDAVARAYTCTQEIRHYRNTRLAHLNAKQHVSQTGETLPEQPEEKEDVAAQMGEKQKEAILELAKRAVQVVKLQRRKSGSASGRNSGATGAQTTTVADGAALDGEEATITKVKGVIAEAKQTLERGYRNKRGRFFFNSGAIKLAVEKFSELTDNEADVAAVVAVVEVIKQESEYKRIDKARAASLAALCLSTGIRNISRVIGNVESNSFDMHPAENPMKQYGVPPPPKNKRSGRPRTGITASFEKATTVTVRQIENNTHRIVEAAKEGANRVDGTMSMHRQLTNLFISRAANALGYTRKLSQRVGIQFFFVTKSVVTARTAGDSVKSQEDSKDVVNNPKFRELQKELKQLREDQQVAIEALTEVAVRLVRSHRSAAASIMKS